MRRYLTIKLYTKQGDYGATQVKGRKISKADALIHAIGEVDELNSYIGGVFDDEIWVLSIRLREVQHTLFEIGAELAGFYEGNYEEHTETLESWIDEIDAQLPPLKQFILPGGHPIAAKLWIARSVCRRAERSVVDVIGGGGGPQIYLNRLSDFLFAAARHINLVYGIKEIPWRGLK